MLYTKDKEKEKLIQMLLQSQQNLEPIMTPVPNMRMQPASFMDSFTQNIIPTQPRPTLDPFKQALSDLLSGMNKKKLLK
jgi:hypothetical protein